MFRIYIMPVALLACMPAIGHANCARDVHDITPKIREIKDDRARQKAEDYLQRANRELSENDEFECQTAVDAIQKMIAVKSPTNAQR